MQVQQQVLVLFIITCLTGEGRYLFCIFFSICKLRFLLQIFTQLKPSRVCAVISLCNLIPIWCIALKIAGMWEDTQEESADSPMSPRASSFMTHSPEMARVGTFLAE